MSLSNLPPGVTESMIPGNEPATHHGPWCDEDPATACEACQPWDEVVCPKCHDLPCACGQKPQCSHCDSTNVVGPFQMDGIVDGVYGTHWHWIVCRTCNRSTWIDPEEVGS